MKLVNAPICGVDQGTGAAGVVGDAVVFDERSGSSQLPSSRIARWARRAADSGLV